MDLIGVPECSLLNAKYVHQVHPRSLEQDAKFARLVKLADKQSELEGKRALRITDVDNV